MSNDKPTPGPWEWHVDKFNGGYSGIFGRDDYPVCVPQCRNEGDSGAAWFETDDDAGEETLTEQDARLITAACNSYQKHCADPVAAAESDLLGECLVALDECVKDLVATQINVRGALKKEPRWRGVVEKIQPTIDQARSLLAKAEGQA